MSSHEWKRDNEAYELVDGELIPLPSPTPLHGIIRDRMVQLIRNYFDGNRIGGAISETDCRVIGDVIRRSDLSIFLAERWQQLDLKTVPVPSAPDITVEVYSPSENAIDATRKVREYLNSGAQEVWLLDSENLELQVRTKAGIRVLNAGDALETPLLPGFSAEVSMLLAGRYSNLHGSDRYACRSDGRLRNVPMSNIGWALTPQPNTISTNGASGISIQTRPSAYRDVAQWVTRERSSRSQWRAGLLSRTAAQQYPLFVSNRRRSPGQHTSAAFSRSVVSQRYVN